jgi:hypothetical protein
MKRLATLPIAIALLAATASAVSARADRTYTVHCSDGNTYETLDAHAVEQGHKGDAVVNFSQNTPFGLTCWLEPTNP